MPLKARGPSVVPVVFAGVVIAAFIACVWYGLTYDPQHTILDDRSTGTCTGSNVITGFNVNSAPTCGAAAGTLSYFSAPIVADGGPNVDAGPAMVVNGQVVIGGEFDWQTGVVMLKVLNGPDGGTTTAVFTVDSLGNLALANDARITNLGNSGSYCFLDSASLSLICNQNIAADYVISAGSSLATFFQASGGATGSYAESSSGYFLLEASGAGNNLTLWPDGGSVFTAGANASPVLSIEQSGLHFWSDAGTSISAPAAEDLNLSVVDGGQCKISSTVQITQASPGQTNALAVVGQANATNYVSGAANGGGSYAFDTSGQAVCSEAVGQASTTCVGAVSSQMNWKAVDGGSACLVADGVSCCLNGGTSLLKCTGGVDVVASVLEGASGANNILLDPDGGTIFGGAIRVTIGATDEFIVSPAGNLYANGSSQLAGNVSMGVAQTDSTVCGGGAAGSFCESSGGAFTLQGGNGSADNEVLWPDGGVVCQGTTSINQGVDEQNASWVFLNVLNGPDAGGVANDGGQSLFEVLTGSTIIGNDLLVFPTANADQIQFDFFAHETMGEVGGNIQGTFGGDNGWTIHAPMGPTPQATFTEQTMASGSASFAANPDGGTLSPVFAAAPISCLSGTWVEQDAGEPATGQYSFTWSPAFTSGPVTCTCSPTKGGGGTCAILGAGIDGGTPTGSIGSATYQFICCGPR